MGVGVAQPSGVAVGPTMGVGVARPGQGPTGVVVGPNAVGMNVAPAAGVAARPGSVVVGVQPGTAAPPPGSQVNPAYRAPGGTTAVAPMGGQVTANPGGSFVAPGLAPSNPRVNASPTVGVGVNTSGAPLPPIYRRPIDPTQITAQPVPNPR
nr:hypothetical protein [Deltaproteobacteria bacterium]